MKKTQIIIQAIMGIFVLLFSLGWTIIALTIAPFMAIFGLLFFSIALINVIKTFKNLNGNEQENFTNNYNRNYNYNKEINLNNEGYTRVNSSFNDKKSTQNYKYCTICGSKVDNEHLYCSNCGAELE